MLRWIRSRTPLPLLVLVEDRHVEPDLELKLSGRFRRGVRPHRKQAVTGRGAPGTSASLACSWDMGGVPNTPMSVMTNVVRSSY